MALTPWSGNVVTMRDQRSAKQTFNEMGTYLIVAVLTFWGAISLDGRTLGLVGLSLGVVCSVMTLVKLGVLWSLERAIMTTLTVAPLALFILLISGSEALSILAYVYNWPIAHAFPLHGGVVLSH